LRSPLDAARFNAIRALEHVGAELFSKPTDGMYLWARFPHIEDSLALANHSAREGFMLAVVAQKSEISKFP
jgi:hypothetical protein